MASQRLWMERNVKALELGVITNKSSYSLHCGLDFSLPQ